MSFDFSAWKGPRSVTQIKAEHAAEDARVRRAAEAEASKAAARVDKPTSVPATPKAA